MHVSFLYPCTCTGSETIDLSCPKVCPAVEANQWTCSVGNGEGISWSIKDSSGVQLGSSLILTGESTGSQTVGTSPFSASLTHVEKVSGTFTSVISSDSDTDIIGYELECSSGDAPAKTCKVLLKGK